MICIAHILLIMIIICNFNGVFPQKSHIVVLLWKNIWISVMHYNFLWDKIENHSSVALHCIKRHEFSDAVSMVSAAIWGSLSLLQSLSFSLAHPFFFSLCLPLWLPLLLTLPLCSALNMKLVKQSSCIIPLFYLKFEHWPLGFYRSPHTWLFLLPLVTTWKQRWKFQLCQQ